MTEALNKLNEVGVLCLKLTHKIRQAEGPKPAQSPISEQVISSQIGQIRDLFKEIDIAALNLSEGEHREELMKYTAIQSCIAAIEGRVLSLHAYRSGSSMRSILNTLDRTVKFQALFVWWSKIFDLVK